MKRSFRHGPAALLLLTLPSLTAAHNANAQESSAPAPSAVALPQIELPQIDAHAPGHERGAAALWQDLQRLNTWASLMMITAHPDDEDGGMLTYESRGMGVRTGLFSLTRGEGGQNAMSGAENDALGLIRTRELLRAGAWYGTVTDTIDGQYWGTVADYGFSKTMEEALGQWGHERVLYDAVRAVRIFRPLVVTSVFVGGPTDGHGQHQVAGLMAQEVFKAAGDPKVFPDQIAAGLEPWQPRKVYARVPSFSISPKGMFDYATSKWAPVRFHDYVHDTWIEGVPATNLEISEGTRDAVMGESYIQTGRRGLGEQKTQHEGPSVPLPGTVTSAYHRYGAAFPGGITLPENEQGFFDGIDTSLPGIAGLAHGDTSFMKQPLTRIGELVKEAALNYSPAQPEKIAPVLAEGYKRTAALLSQVEASGLSAQDKYDIGHELQAKLLQFNQALAEALGIEVAALVTPTAEGPRHLDPYASPSKALPLMPDETAGSVIPGQEFRVRVHIAIPLSAQLTKVSLSTPKDEHWQVTRLGAPGLDDLHSQSGDVLFGVVAAKDAKPTAPYFSRASTEQPFYDLLEPQWRNRSFAPYPVAASAEFTYKGVPIRLARTVETMHRVVGLGAVYAPLLVTPEISVTLAQHAGIVPLPATDGASSLTIPVRVHSDATGTAEGTLRLDLPQGWQADPAMASFRLRGGEDQTVAFKVQPGRLSTEQYTVKAIAVSGNYRYTSGYESAGYTGIAPYNLYRPAEYRVSGVDVKVAPGLNVGYVMGTGDEVPEALAELGIHPHLLATQDLLTGDLSQYDTIVLGIRAYAARPELAAATARLLSYVHDGGTLVTQYMSPGSDGNYGPYAYVLGGNPEKVVDEHAPVALLLPAHPLLNWPNHITSADFDGWIEERGHSFLQSWSPHYQALTETHDPDQDPQRGGLLYARYGQGVYIYAAYALYRQTPEGVPGAFRLLANLVSAGKNPHTPAMKTR